MVFEQVAVARGLSGVGLALVTPAIQSLVADYTDDNNALHLDGFNSQAT
jgi:acyl dehydratase